MAAAPNLKMVAEAATGYNNIDTEYAKAHGIRVANVAGYSTQSVIQHTFALAFYLIEKMRYYDDYVKSGAYADCPIFTHFGEPFHELYGMTWGIIGLGTIARWHRLLKALDAMSSIILHRDIIRMNITDVWILMNCWLNLIL